MFGGGENAIIILDNEGWNVLKMFFSTFHFDYPYDQVPVFNIGDYIQAIAATRFLPRVDFTIDRDSISSFNSKAIGRGEIKLIGNSWYSVRREAHTVPDCIDFLPISVHINNPKGDILEVLKSWANYGPIGCRDIQTHELIQSHGFDSYFSSCLTTTLTREYVLSGERQTSLTRKNVVLVDVYEESPKIRFWQLHKLPQSYKKASEYSKAIKQLHQLLKHYEGEKIERITHLYPMALNQNDRFEIARKLLIKYASAKLVITSRIHCALPCLALGTPVVLMTKKYDELRYRGLYEFLNHIGLDQNLNLSVDIEFKHGDVINKDTHLAKANNLISRCNDFVNNK